MKDFGSRKEKYNYHNSLTSLVKALENKHTVIDLRNESCVSGLIKYVDGLMNVEMQDVTFFDSRGQVHQFKDFFISARNIRYVHIPEGLDSTQLLNNQMGLLQGTKVQKPKTFKTTRAERYHEEILRGLDFNKPGPSTG